MDKEGLEKLKDCLEAFMSSLTLSAPLETFKINFKFTYTRLLEEK